MQYKNRFSTL